MQETFILTRIWENTMARQGEAAVAETSHVVFT